MDWYDRLERFVVERRAQSAVLTVGLIGGALWMPRCLSDRQVRVERDHQKHLAERQTIESHKTWLRSLPVEEKRTWSLSICRPSARQDGKCACGDFETQYYDMVAFAEVLPNGDVACHLTK